MTNLPAEHEGLLRVGPQASRHLDRPQEVEAGPTPGEAGRLVTNQVHLVLHTPSTSFVPRKQLRKKMSWYDLQGFLKREIRCHLIESCLSYSVINMKQTSAPIGVCVTSRPFSKSLRTYQQPTHQDTNQETEMGKLHY